MPRHRISMSEFEKMDPADRDWKILEALYDGDDTMEELLERVDGLDKKVEKNYKESCKFREKCQAEMNQRIEGQRRLLAGHVKDTGKHQGNGEKTKKERIKEGGVFTVLVSAIATLIYAVAEYLKSL